MKPDDYIYLANPPARGRAQSWLIVALVVVSAIALWSYTNGVRADSRADAAVAAFEAKTEQYTADSSRWATSIDSLERGRDTILVSRDSAIAVADSIEPTLRTIVDTLYKTLPAPLQPLFEEYRTRVRGVIASLRTAIVQGDSAIASFEVQLALSDSILLAAQDRLAEALAGWELSEKARRPGIVTWIQRGLAGYGLVRFMQEVF